MTTSPFDPVAFETHMRAEGYEAVLERVWPPLTVLDTHTHPFAAKAIVTQGEMWLTVAGTTRHLRPGDGFELAPDVPHAERYGAEGATYWVARRGAGTADAGDATGGPARHQ